MALSLSKHLTARNLALALIGLYCALFWWVRIIHTPSVTFGRDSTVYAYPIMRYGFEMLRSGTVPLWNPFQLCGVPHLAAPYSAMFYPPNLIYLLPDTAVAMELGMLAHLIFAGWGMWAFVRLLGMPRRAAFVAALTFCASGGATVFSEHPESIHAAVCWLPATLWLIERSLRGGSLPLLGLLVAVTAQVLNGATEIVFYNLSLGAGYAGFRLTSVGRSEGMMAAAKRGGILIACVAGGGALASFQLFPTLELVGQTRRAGGVSIGEALLLGSYTHSQFFHEWVSARGSAAAGVLAVTAAVLGFGVREHRRTYFFFLLVAVLTALVMFGGWAFELFHSLPIVELFRRPNKLIYLHHFAQAMIVAVAFCRVIRWSGSEGAVVGRSPIWGLAFAWSFVAAYWLAQRGEGFAYLLGAIIVFLVFASPIGPSLRRVSVLGLIALQAASLFWGNFSRSVRPIDHMNRFHAYDVLLRTISKAGSKYRVYVDPIYNDTPGLTPKQGMISGIRVVRDYTALITVRNARFIEGIRSEMLWWQPGDPVNFEWMDLASARFYITKKDSELERRIMALATGTDSRGDGVFIRLSQHRDAVLWLRRSALPRAYYVGSAREFSNTEALLEELSSSVFRPRYEVLLEADASLPADGGATAHGVGNGSSRIIHDQPERVEIEVEADQPGYLILADSYYPGWEAAVNGEKVPIRRANYLFRAVPVRAGVSRVEFRYRPKSLRYGVFVSGASAIVIFGVFLFGIRRRASGRGDQSAFGGR